MHILYLNTPLLFLFLGLFSVKCASSQILDSSSTIPTQSIISIIVANHEQFWKYEFKPDSMLLELVTQAEKNKDTNWSDQVVPILKQWDKKNKTQSRLAEKLNAKWASGSKWAERSPGEKYVLVGYEDPMVDARRTLKIFDTSIGVCLKSIKYEDACIEDFVWSPDSKYLLIIEEQERLSKSIEGLLVAITGHPIPLESYTISVLNISSGEIRKLPLAEDIKRGQASISVQR
jgi:hypothetical protein